MCVCVYVCGLVYVYTSGNVGVWMLLTFPCMSVYAYTRWAMFLACCDLLLPRQSVRQPEAEAVHATSIA